MTKIRKLTVGGLVGAILTFGLTAMAPAAPAWAAGVTNGTTPSSSTPSSSTPSSSTPSSSARSHTLTGGEIWRIVHPYRGINCAHAANELKRVQAADVAATKRMGRFRTMASTFQSKKSTKAAARVKHSSAQVRGFQKLENAGQALIKRIEARCPAAAHAA